MLSKIRHTRKTSSKANRIGKLLAMLIATFQACLPKRQKHFTLLPAGGAGGGAVAGVWAVAALCLFTSCLREDLKECPPFTVRIVVKDKNYFNVNKVESEEAVDENLPFAAYVPTLCYMVRNIDTGEVLDRRDLHNVDPQAMEIKLDYGHDVPYGRYVFTVWGGLTNAAILGTNAQSALLHPDNLPGDDLYLSNDTILYDYRHDSATLEMERVKGKLIIEAENLPLAATGIEKTATHLRSEVNNKFEYSGDIKIPTSTHWTEPTTSFVEKTILAPSIGDKLSSVSTQFLHAAGEPTVPQSVKITMLRNSLTVVRYVWNPDNGEFDIYVLLDNTWDKLNNLHLEED